MIKKLIFAIAAVCVSATISSCTESPDNHITELRLVSMTPTTGFSGEVATVYGTNFSPEMTGNVVSVNGREAQILKAATGSIQFILPANDPGTYPITVSVGDNAIEGLAFTYIRQPSRTYVVSTAVGSGVRGNVDAIGTDAQIGMPRGLTRASDGSIWFTDDGANSIRKIGTDMSVSTVVAGDKGLNAPWQGGFDKNGNYYVASKGNSKVFKVAPDGETTEFASGINNPMGCVCDEEGNVYVASRDHKKIIRYTPAGQGEDFVVFDDVKPNCIYRAADGTFYVGDTGSYVITQISADGKTVKAIAGNGVKPDVNDDGEQGNAMSASIGYIFGIDMDDNGVIYFTDAKSHTIRMLIPDASGDYTKGSVETIAGTGKNGNGNGIGLKAIFNNPYGILVSGDGSTIYVADTSNEVIRCLTLRQ